MNWQQKTGGPEAPPSRPPGKVRTHQGSDHCHANTIREAKGTTDWSLQARTPGTVEETPPLEGFVTKQPAIRSHPCATRTLYHFAPFCPREEEAVLLMHVHDSVITDWTDQDPPLSVSRRRAPPAICIGQSAINTSGRKRVIGIFDHSRRTPRDEYFESRTDSNENIYWTPRATEIRTGSSSKAQALQMSTSTQSQHSWPIHASCRSRPRHRCHHCPHHRPQQ